MKKVVLTPAVLALLVVMIGADIRKMETPVKPMVVKKRPCYGYTIIEFGKGINCYGDTISLSKVKGGQQYVNHKKFFHSSDITIAQK